MLVPELALDNLGSDRDRKDGGAYSRSRNIIKEGSMGRIGSRRVLLLGHRANKGSSTKIKARHRKDILDTRKAGAMGVSTRISQGSNIGNDRTMVGWLDPIRVIFFRIEIF